MLRCKKAHVCHWGKLCLHHDPKIYRLLKRSDVQNCFFATLVFINKWTFQCFIFCISFSLWFRLCQSDRGVPWNAHPEKHLHKSHCMAKFTVSCQQTYARTTNPLFQSPFPFMPYRLYSCWLLCCQTVFTVWVHSPLQWKIRNSSNTSLHRATARKQISVNQMAHWCAIIGLFDKICSVVQERGVVYHGEWLSCRLWSKTYSRNIKH